MSAPRIVNVVAGSPAARAGVLVGDEVLAVDGESPRDVIRWTWLTDEADPTLDLRRGSLDVTIEVEKGAGEPLGIDVHSALFDQLRTCDNHCEFCFIYQLPAGLRKSLYLKDDDYRLSFLYVYRYPRTAPTAPTANSCHFSTDCLKLRCYPSCKGCDLGY